MSNDFWAGLARLMKIKNGEIHSKTSVTGVTGVTDQVTTAFHSGLRDDDMLATECDASVTGVTNPEASHLSHSRHTRGMINAADVINQESNELQALSHSSHLSHQKNDKGGQNEILDGMASPIDYLWGVRLGDQPLSVGDLLEFERQGVRLTSLEDLLRREEGVA